jgi:hypothetical protein
VKVPFTWKITGWFMVGWSPQFPVGETRPLQSALSREDAKGYMALRKWAAQFYEVTA